MQRRPYIILGAILTVGAMISTAGALASPSATTEHGVHLMHAQGPFDVKINPLDAYNRDEGAALSRMSIDKQFHGDLEATSKGEMLATMDKATQSGGYVAIERVTGTLGGKKGSFVLQHSSTMRRGQPKQNVSVAPGSGTGELTGLSGSLIINIAADGAHSYDFEYSFNDDK
jgi:Protein of unknown function (DUF3224)